jgi:hypothetical protein
MLAELPPRSLPTLLLVRKMLTLVRTSLPLVGETSSAASLRVELTFPPALSPFPFPHYRQSSSLPRVSLDSPVCTGACTSCVSLPSTGQTQTDVLLYPSQLQLNSTPLVSPSSKSGPSIFSDRQRSSAAFDAHMQQFSFLNTKRSRALIAEVWERVRLFLFP